MQCSICNSDHVFVKYNLFDDRYGYNGEFYLIRCNDCLHQWLDCSFTPEQISNLYSDYYPKYPPQSGKPGSRLSNKQRRERRITNNPLLAWLYGKRSSALQWVPENIRLLDIGCGVGGHFNHHILRGCDVYGIEANENARDIVEKSGYKIHIGLFNKDLFEPEFFDFITMDQVIEHMVSPLHTLQGISGLLKKHGKLIVSTPNANGWGAKVFKQRWIHWHTPYHLHFFSRRSLGYLADKAGLKIIRHRTITDSQWLNMQWAHLATYPQKGEPSTFWGKHLFSGDKLPENHNMLFNTISIFDKGRLNDWVTRLFDMLHLGDNQVFILQKNI